MVDSLKMYISMLLAALPLFGLIIAVPVQIEKRALSANNTMVLKLAITLEYLEYSLYSSGYNSFSDADFTSAGFPAGFRDNVGVIASVGPLFHAGFPVPRY